VIEPNTCKLETETFNLTRDNQGNNDAADDTFSLNLKVTAVRNNGSTGWVTSDTAPASGNYGDMTGFGPFLVSNGPKSITVRDNLDNNCSSTVDVVPPSCVIDTPVIANLMRNEQGTVTLADDTMTFDVTITATGGGTGWTSGRPFTSWARRASMRTHRLS